MLRVLYSTFASEEDAKKMAKKLLEQQLIACANLYPIDSLYSWEGKLVDEKEFALWCKTTEEQSALAAKYIEKNHPYETPVVMSFGVDDVPDKYQKWVHESVETP